MKNDDFIKTYVRLKPLMMDEAAVITPSRRDVTVTRTKECFSFSKKSAMQLRCSTTTRTTSTSTSAQSRPS